MNQATQYHTITPDSPPFYTSHLQPTTSTISHSSSLSTVALSTSCGSLTTSLSSAYSLSTINSDLELGHFINDNCYYSTQSLDRIPHEQAADYILPIHKPHGDLKRPPTFKRATTKHRSGILSRRFKVASNLSLTPWECVVYAAFACYLWILLCALVGSSSIVTTCTSLSDGDTAVNVSSFSTSKPTLGSSLHHHAIPGLERQTADVEYVAREHVVPPTPHP